ncbi:MAG: hypothetical protein Q9186_004246 [Xanthomendoza sp. 1 TL-2023]
MKQSLALTWRFLTSKLHQPLPLNRRESQQLLTLLNDSFNRNLDREYPKGLANFDHSPDDHIHSLLQSPLFGSSRVQHSSPPVRVSELSRNAFVVRDMYAVEQPVQYFKQQVAAGKANIESAKLALHNQMKKDLASASLDLKHGMGTSGIGSLVVNWLWSSGQIERLDFIQDRAFTARLMPFLVAEKLYKPIWEWLQRSCTIPRYAVKENAWLSLRKGTGSMFCSLLQSEVAYGEGLQSAIQMFLTSHKSMTLSLPLRVHKINAAAGAYLVWEFASKGASAKLGDSTIEDLDRSVDYWASRRMIAPYKALLELSHPRRPTTSRALQWMSTIEASAGEIAAHSRESNVRIGLKTVEVLLAQGSSKEAARVMKVLQTLFAPEVGSDEERRDSNEGEKESISRSLNLLLAT